MSSQDIAVVVGVVLAFCGYLATYVNNRLVEKRRERLVFINKQINDFYGPLYVASIVGQTAYHAIVAKLGRRHDPNLNTPLADEEFAEWRLWVVNVFMPMNLWCERILLDNAHLIREREIPQCVLQFITHVSAFKAVVKKWESGDFSERFSLIEYPDELRAYAANAYRELKARQLGLLGGRPKEMGSRKRRYYQTSVQQMFDRYREAHWDD